MGLRLEGPTIRREPDPDRPSSPVSPGAIQVTGGQAIILGVAGGTMGGYLHLAHIITTDLDRIAQLRPGDPLTFQRITIEEAREVDRRDRLERDRWLALIRSTQE
jgi:antagonist of KipI